MIQFSVFLSVFLCCICVFLLFLLSDLVHFALFFFLFRFVKMLKIEKSRPDVKVYWQTFNTRVFLVETPNCLDIN